MQVVNFTTLPNKKPEQYLFTLASLHRFVRDQKPSYREFRRYLLENDLLNKETLTEMLDFIEVTAAKGKPTTIGDFLTNIFATAAPVEQQKFLFNRLARKNEILVKYVMDGLSERLYSTNELYRFITSYVYPGDYVTLVNFRAWMTWLEVSQHIKMIGIRWGLSPLGEKAMDYIKTIDVDMLLEMEEDGEEDDDWSDDDDWDDEKPATASAPAVAAVVAPAAVAAPVAVVAASSEVAAAPVAAVVAPAAAPAVGMMAPPAGAVFAVGAPQVVIPAGVETVRVIVQPVEAKLGGAPLKLLRESFESADEEVLDDMGESTTEAADLVEQLRIEPELASENLRAVTSWWNARPPGRLLRSSDYGFSKELYDASPALAFFRLSCLAVSLFRFEGRLQVSKGSMAFGMLDQMGFFSNLFESTQSIDDILDGLFKGGLLSRPELFGNLHYFILLRRAIREMGDEGVIALGKREDPSDLVGTMWQKLGHFSLSYEVLWISRELHLLGAWEGARGLDLGVIPLPKVRENAFLLGFIETPYAADFPSLVGISRRLSALFGKREDFEAPLMYFVPRQSELNYDRSESSFFSRDQLGMD